LYLESFISLSIAKLRNWTFKMSEEKSTGNPIFDLWLSNQEQFLEAQSSWLKPQQAPANPFVNMDFLDSSMQSWKQCEEQYKNWTRTAENWFGGSLAGQQEGEEQDHSAQALAYLLNPAIFMKSGFEMMDQVFRKLVNGPEFADIGMLEKKMLKSGQDWQAFKDAGQHYQEVITDAWQRAYQHFSDEFMDQMNEGDVSSEEMLKRWLKIADEELTTTLRSDDYLEAQREFFSKGSAYRLKYQEFVELWSEAHAIPTRREVDDLHKIIYELRREVRALKKQVATLRKGSEEKPVKNVAQKSDASAVKATVKKAPAKKKTPARKAKAKAKPE